MATKKLHYFDVNGLGESIRYMLHYAGEKFEDIRYDRKTWPIKNVKESLPFGLLPLYEEGNRSLHQSLAIARYVARKANLVPTDPWEEAVLDAVVYSVYDIWGHLIPYIKETDPKKKQEIKKMMMDETIDYFFSRFEKDLKNHGGYFGGKLSWADFILVTFVEACDLYFDTEIEKNYPTVQALVQKIKSLPRVKDYIATRKPYTV